jgi:hypothetical protein
VGDGVNLPGDGYGLGLSAEDGCDAGELVAAKVAEGEGLHAAGGWLGGRRNHLLGLAYIAVRGGGVAGRGVRAARGSEYASNCQ